MCELILTKLEIEYAPNTPLMGIAYAPSQKADTRTAGLSALGYLYRVHRLAGGILTLHARGHMVVKYSDTL